jgi:cytochrome c-type biogenesis protein CcmH
MTAVFWGCLALLLAGSLAGLLRPFLRRSVALQGPSPDLAVYRRQQAEIDADLAAGVLDSAAADEARAEIARRVLRFEAQAAASEPKPAGKRARRIAIGAVAVVVPVASISLYLALGQPAAVNGQAAAMAASGNSDPTSPHTSAELAVSAKQLADRLAADPKDANGWVLLGRTYAALEKYGDAADAFAKAIALVPGEPSLHAQRGEVLALAAEGTVTDAAVEEFKQADDDPRARFYLAARAAQNGEADDAIKQLKSLLADAPPDASWRSMVVDALDELGVKDAGSTTPAAAPAPAAPSTAPRGPTQDQVAAAQQMSSEDRQTMIRGMVDGLAARLEADPSDKAGWARLATAYDVLGEKDKAAAARAHAADTTPAAAPATGPAASAPRGPTQDQVAAAQQMAPADRQAMIRSMVDGLAARLEADPSDKAGWARLATAYDVLGEKDKAAVARARATGAPVPTPTAAVAPAPAAAPAAGNPLEQKAKALSASLETHPDDTQSWLDLARTYRGLGREADAMATLKQANQKLPGTLDLLEAYADGLSKSIDGEKLPPEFVEVMTQINAIDADQPDALWYLGLAAERRGDSHRARTYWTRLANHLPDGDEKQSVRRRLAALK